MSKKLSIAIPTYNRLSYLKQCIQGLLNQTFQDFSIFVFDNHSDEPIEEELKKFNDKRIYFIGNDKNIGSPGNINRILNYPFQSKYLTIFHDDDLMHSRMLELQTSFLDTNDNIAFIVSKFNRVSGENISHFKEIEENKIEYIIYKNNYEFTKAIMSWTRFAFSSAMYRTKMIGSSRMDFNRFSDTADRAFLAEFSQKGISALINAPMVNYRIHPGQDSKLVKNLYEDGAIETLLFLRENLPNVLNKKDKKLFSKYSLNVLLWTYVNINGGFCDFLRFIKKCRKMNLVQYKYFRYLDLYGLISLVSIVFKNKGIFNKARSAKDLFKN